MSRKLASVYRVITIVACFLVIQIVCQRQPRNITRADGETDVFIPCPFEFRPTPSIWIINGTDYTTATIASLNFSITPGGLFINIVTVCLNQTSFQCIDTSNALEQEVSDVGILTVTASQTIRNCTGELLASEESVQLELNHRLIQHGSASTTLAWKIYPVETDLQDTDCSTSHIMSYGRCQQNNVDLNRTTEDEMIVLSSANLQISGELADFNISTSNGQQLDECPSLMESVRLNVTDTEIVNLLLGNNNCSTCVAMERQGDLSFVISNPDPNQVDIKCQVHANGCYSPTNCNNFINSILDPFFHICPSENSRKVCFDNISETLNGLRLEFYSLKRALCISTPVYIAREYFKSLEFNTINASARIAVNTTSREICFTSSLKVDCTLADFTWYNTSIVDITGSTILKMDNIPESTCLTVNHLGLLPQCGPFWVSTQPFNDYIMYNQDVQQIISGVKLADDQPRECSCLKTSTQLEFTMLNYSESLDAIQVSYDCWTIYAVPIGITLTDGDGFVYQNICLTDQTITLSTGSNRCGEFSLCGFFNFVNNSVLADCSLNCSNSVQIPCPPDSSLYAIIGGVLFGILVIVVVVLIVIVCFVHHRRRQTHRYCPRVEYVPPNNINPEGQIAEGNDDHDIAINGDNAEAEIAVNGE